MAFSSATFLFLFFPAVFLLDRLFQKRMEARNALLIAADLVFYAWGEPVYVLLMLASTLVNYFIARQMERSARKKALLLLACALNLGALVYFKYAAFLLSPLGVSLTIALPVGISFYTFQALGYVIDVYRGETPAARGYGRVLLYIGFFPQLIAGPIVRYRDIAPQLTARVTTPESTAAGLRRFVIGLSKKILLANLLGAVVDGVYALPAARINAPLAWGAAIGYLLQIYLDFSGYSDMALGMGRMFGFTYPENFNYPYTALSMQDFWRRWHISLSTWFREYVYIPLGGNRRGKWRTGLNRLAVFFLTGLWHGASWNFIVWGLYNGLFLLLEGYGVYHPGRWPVLLRRLYTLLVVTVGFVFFRAADLPQAAHMLRAMAVGWTLNADSLAALSTLFTPLYLAALLVGALAAAPLCAYLKRFKGASYVSAAATVLLLLGCMLCVAASAYDPFIYFRF